MTNTQADRQNASVVRLVCCQTCFLRVICFFTVGVCGVCVSVGSSIGFHFARLLLESSGLLWCRDLKVLSGFLLKFSRFQYGSCSRPPEETDSKCTTVQNYHESRLKHWAIGSSVYSFAFSLTLLTHSLPSR